MPSTTTTADARSRALRTVLQGAVSTILVAVAAVVLDQVTAGQIVDYATLGAAAATAAGTAITAYVHRLLSGRDLDDAPNGSDGS